jgi:hypothetical protein
MADPPAATALRAGLGAPSRIRFADKGLEAGAKRVYCLTWKDNQAMRAVPVPGERAPA